MAINLCVLAFFKYYNFFATGLDTLASIAGFHHALPSLNIILPVGISFYTFQSMSYTIDIYRKTRLPETSFVTFATYVAFFPQLVAGPIERSSHLIPQIKQKQPVSGAQIQKALWLMLWGYVLKVFMADNLSTIVDVIYQQKQSISGIDVLISQYAFAFQIFGDFAGYSYIAIGVAQLFGVKLCDNFRFPYLVKKPAEFWQHWHISLSSWIRDYIYIPLGGNRQSSINTAKTVIITMGLCGLWHGAAWNFIFWGLYQGTLLIIFSRKSKKISTNSHSLTSALQIILMFHLTCLGWMLFRTKDESTLIMLFNKLLFHFSNVSPKTIYWAGNLIFFTFIPMLIHFYQFKTNTPQNLPFKSAVAKIITVIGLIYILMTFGNWGTKSFIYFQF